MKLASKKTEGLLIQSLSQLSYPFVVFDDISPGRGIFFTQGSHYEGGKEMSTIAAISTPLSASGLGVIRISGEEAVSGQWLTGLW